MRAAILAPLYLSFSWVLTISYQLFTDTAVKTLSINIFYISPAIASWLGANLTTVAFVYAFSWIFILSSVLPSLILGKERSVLVQYLVSMTLTVIALSTTSLLSTYGGIQAKSIFNPSILLKSPLIAIVYLFIPYVVMIVLDLRARKKRRIAARRVSIEGNQNENRPIVLPSGEL